MAYAHNAYMNLPTLFHIKHAFFTKSPPFITGGLNTYENNKLEPNFGLRQKILEQNKSLYHCVLSVWPISLHSVYNLTATLFHSKHAFFTKPLNLRTKGLNTSENIKFASVLACLTIIETNFIIIQNIISRCSRDL